MDTLWSRLVIAAVGPFLTIAALMVWRYTDDTAAELHRLDTEIKRVDAKLDARFGELNTLLTDNLITLSGDVGALKAISHSHTQP